MTFICPTQCLSWVWRTDGVLCVAVWDCRVAMPTGTVESNHSHRWWKLEVPWPLKFLSKQLKLSYFLLNMHRNIMVLRLIQLTNTSTGEFKTLEILLLKGFFFFFWKTLIKSSLINTCLLFLIVWLSSQTEHLFYTLANFHTQNFLSLGQFPAFYPLCSQCYKM